MTKIVELFKKIWGKSNKNNEQTKNEEKPKNTNFIKPPKIKINEITISLRNDPNKVCPKCGSKKLNID